LPFARVHDAAFWADKEQIKDLIDLHEYYECLWKVQSVQQATEKYPRKKPPKSKFTSI